MKLFVPLELLFKYHSLMILINIKQEEISYVCESLSFFINTYIYLYIYFRTELLLC